MRFWTPILLATAAAIGWSCDDGGSGWPADVGPDDGVDQVDVPVDVVDDVPADPDAEPDPTQTLLWARNAGGPESDRAGCASAFPDGSLVVTGEFADTAVFGAGGSHEVSVTSEGGSDIFVAKYDAAGEPVWVKTAGQASTFQEQGTAAAALADGSSVVSGWYHGVPTFGAGETNETELLDAGEDNVFVARYNADGTLAWARRVVGVWDDYPEAMAAAPDGTVVVVGSFTGPAVFGEGDTNETLLIPPGSMDEQGFISKYNPDGTLAWALQVGGDGTDVTRGVAVAPDGTVVACGQFQLTATVGEAGGPTLVADGSADVFVVGVSAGGTVLWAKRAGGSGSDIAYAAAARSDGGFYVVGTFSGTATFGPGESAQAEVDSTGDRDAFVARYNADGTLAWARGGGGAGPDNGRAVAVTTGDWPLVAGDFFGSATFGDTTPVGLESSTGSDVEGFLVAYDESGALRWARSVGGASGETIGCAARAGDAIIVSGGFSGNIRFWAGEPGETTLTAGPPATFSDAFLAKFTP